MGLTPPSLRGPSELVIIGTALNSSQRAQLQQLCKLLNATLVTDFHPATVTHVVTGARLFLVAVGAGAYAYLVLCMQLTLWMSRSCASAR